jgi:hypothetical protein
VNVLICGRGKGSWEMRGVQVGDAIGARVVSVPSYGDLKWADIVVLIKRAGMEHAKRVHRSGKPIVWDALDYWSQPAHNRLTREEARHEFAGQIRAISPHLVIGATKAQADDAKGEYIPHHSWSGLSPAPCRDEMRVVGYEGNPIYLGAWATALEDICLSRGWSFVVNPPSLSDCDLLVSLRDGVWDGWMCREWKSGVKVVNAIAAGRPIIAQPSAAMRDIQPPGSVVENVVELRQALERWAARDWRTTCVEVCRQKAVRYTLNAVARHYKLMLSRVAESVGV